MFSQVLGSGPVGFTDNYGTQHFIPLSVLYFDDKGIQVGNWPLYKTEHIKKIVDGLLNSLVTQGLLNPSPKKPPQQALILKAADPGAAGNNIQVTFSDIAKNLQDPDNPKATTFTVTITETETYEGLSFDSASPAYIKNVLGTGEPDNNKGGLVHSLDENNPSFPPKPTPEAYKLKLPENNNQPIPTEKAFVSVPAASGSTFTLKARKPGKDGENTSVSISNVNVDAKTFSLTAVWKQSVTNITLETLSAQLEEGGKYLIIVEPPGKDGFTIIPATGTVRLSGGADKKEAFAASATVFGS